MGKTNERRTSMSGEEAGGLKTCPRCGAKLFADMDVCYGCLYDFATEHERPVDVGDGGVMSELLQALDEPDLAEGPTPGSVPPESGRALEAVGTAPTGGRAHLARERRASRARGSPRAAHPRASCHGAGLHVHARSGGRPLDWEGSWQRRRGHVRVRIAPSS